MEEKYIKIKEASGVLGVSKLTLRNWDKAGKLTAYRHPMNNYRVYLKEDLDKIIQKMESGEKPIMAPRPKKVIHREEKKFYKLEVKHLTD